MLFSAPVAADRIITKLPQPYKSDATPHKKLNFDPRVQGVCSEYKTGTVGLKICKAVLVGDVAVGKTSVVRRFCHNIYELDYKATIGVDFEVEKFSVLNVHFNLQMWDTAGQERFKCIAASYYRGANVLIIVFDMTSDVSLDHCLKWKNEAMESTNDPLVFLIGTKKDLMSEENLAVVEGRATKIASEMGAEYWSTSSRTGENVDKFFLRAVALTFNRAVLQEIDTIQRRISQIGMLDSINLNEKPDDLNVNRSNSQNPYYSRTVSQQPNCCN